MYKYYKKKSANTIQVLCSVDKNGKPDRKFAIIGTERELLDFKIILPRYRHFTDADVNDDNYLAVLPSGKVVSCGTLDVAKEYLSEEFMIDK